MDHLPRKTMGVPHPPTVRIREGSVSSPGMGSFPQPTSCTENRVDRAIFVYPGQKPLDEFPLSGERSSNFPKLKMIWSNAKQVTAGSVYEFSFWNLSVGERPNYPSDSSLVEPTVSSAGVYVPGPQPALRGLVHLRPEPFFESHGKMTLDPRPHPTAPCRTVGEARALRKKLEESWASSRAIVGRFSCPVKELSC